MNNMSINSASASPLLDVRHLHRTFEQGGVTLPVLQDINFTIGAGELVALIGPSGAGKSTLLQIAGLLEKPSKGEVWIQGQSCQNMTDGERTHLRCRTIGYVYQFHHLLPEFSALENIMLPQMMAKMLAKEASHRGLQLLKTLSLEKRADHRPAQLSGGEQQRVAILRALANSPALIIADEPTGNLDEKTALHVFQELVQLVKGSNKSALVATHNLNLARQMDRVFSLHQGCLKEEIL